jgi:hypothetical protein
MCLYCLFIGSLTHVGMLGARDVAVDAICSKATLLDGSKSCRLV